LFLD